VVARHDPVDDLGGVDGVELVEEVERGESPVRATGTEVLHHQRLERVLLLRDTARERGTGESSPETVRVRTRMGGRLLTFSAVTM
jgi:hypothetical protein